MRPLQRNRREQPPDAGKITKILEGNMENWKEYLQLFGEETGAAQEGQEVPAGQTSQPPQEDPAAEFQELIRGKYRPQFEEEMSRTLASLREAGARDQRFRADALRHAAARQTMDSWKEQAQKLRQEQPEFDLLTAAKDPAFAKLLRSGVDVAGAWYLMNREEALRSAREQGASAVRAGMLNEFLAAGSRPAENGTGHASPALTPTDVAHMTAQQRKELRQRAARGEKIRF